MNELLPWIGLVALLAGSGFFNASETALFSLPPAERHRAGHRAARLLDRPRELLVAILLGSVLVNLLFFASTKAVLRASGFHHPFYSGLGALVAIVVFGEIVPKTLALRAPLIMARIASLPLEPIVFLLRPVGRGVTAFLEVSMRTLGDVALPERPISRRALAEALERSAHQGVLAPGEAGLLAEIVELSSLRVREIMTPRVDVLILDLDLTAEDHERVKREALTRLQSWLPVVRGGVDNVVGCVELRKLVAHPDRPLAAQVMPVKYVPEVARVLAVLQSLREARVGEAVVIDEWGGMAGIVTLERIFEELVGDLRVEGEALEKPVVPLGEGRFRVAGSLAIRDWNDAFGSEVVPTEFETVGGFVTAMLGRIPAHGDRVELDSGLVMTVHEVRGRRVLSVDLSLVPDDETPRKRSA